MSVARGMWLVACWVAVVAGVSCRHEARPQVYFDRAIVETEHVDAAVEIERKLSERYERFAPEAEGWFEVLPGKSKVLVVAGHATAHTREGAMKVADAGTGSLAVMLNRLAGCPVIHTTWRSRSDPNYYNDNEFKERLAGMIREYRPALVLDIHGSNSNRPYDLDFGTRGGRSLLGEGRWMVRMSEILREEGVLNFSQDYFSAGREGTVTSFVSGMGVPCVQLEFSSSSLVRPREGDMSLYRHRFGQVLQGMVRFVREVDAERGGVRGSAR